MLDIKKFTESRCPTGSHRDTRYIKMRTLGQPYKRPNKKGWWLRWTDPYTKKRKCESFETRRLADLRRSILMQQINSEVYIGSVSVPMSDAQDEYLRRYETLNLADASRYEAQLALKRLISAIGDIPTAKLSQSHFDTFLQDHSSKVGPWTVNKTIGRLTAFLNWASCPQRRYITTPITLQKVKTPPVIVTVLTDQQIRSLIERAPSEAWKIRILISLTTGFRKNDTDSLRTAELDIDDLTIRSVAFKTGKPLTAPLPDKLAPMLTAYITSLPSNQEKLFADRNTRKIWDSFKQGITRQDLRKTFSTLIQTIGSIDSARDLLQHSSDRTTNQFYTDRQFVLRWKVNQLPIDKWISK